MQKSEKVVNVVLAVLVAGLLAICVMSILGQMQAGAKTQQTEYAGND
ncbi:MAG: hypothetical protein ACSW8D_14495 [Prevotella sp.]|jgi:L-asparagine transporter-like permease